MGSDAAVFESFEAGSGPGRFYNASFGNYTEVATVKDYTTTSFYLFTSGRSLIVADSFALTFDKPIDIFSYVGSLESGNTVSLFFDDGTSRILNGFGIAGTNSSYANTQGRITYDRGKDAGISRIVFASAGNFAIDDLAAGFITPAAAAVPEPQTWLIIMIGLGYVGVLIRRRRRSTAALS